MKLTAEQRKLLETMPFSILQDTVKRRRAIEIGQRKVLRAKESITMWTEKLKEAEADLKVLIKVDGQSQ